MSALRHRAELQRLARVLGTGSDKLAYLEALDLVTLKQLRERSTAMLYDADRESLQRIASAARLLPAAITALIAEKSLGPLLCARIAGLMAVETAVDVAKRLPTGFLADVCLELDPRRAKAVVDGIPVPRVVDVSLELARRGEYITMGHFVDILSVDALAAVMDRLRDDTALLKVAFYAEDRPRLNRIIEKLPTARFGGIIDAALADGGELWPEALSLIGELELRWRRKFGEIALTGDAASIAQIILVSDTQSLWPALMPLADAVANDTRAVAGLHAALCRQKPALLKRLHAAAAAHGGAMLERLATLDWPAALRDTMTARRR